MKFSDFYKSGLFRHSFEVFPPKTPTGVELLITTLKELKATAPAYISVTYGAMGTTRDLTGDLAIRIHRETGVPTAFHFTCVGSDREAIRQYITRLKLEGINLVVALRGDQPQGVTDFSPPIDGFHYANELVAYIKSINGFSMAVAGYPEGHIEATDLVTDLGHLKRKVDAGADVVITQLFFNNDDYFVFVERARKIGIQVPIIAGIMPILSLQQINRIAKMCGAKIPVELQKKLESCGDNAVAMREVGTLHALKQCLELKKQKVPGVHFYILNKVESVVRILQEL